MNQKGSDQQDIERPSDDLSERNALCSQHNLVPAWLRWPPSPHLLVAASAWGSRLINMAVQLFCIRLLLPKLGTEQYAAYILLNSLAGWYLLADMGIGYSLQNYISECRAKGASYQEYLMAALLSGGLLLVGISVGLFFVSPFLGPLLLKHSYFLSSQEKSHAFLISGLFFAIFGVSSMGLKFWYALQKGYVSNLLTAFASLLTLFGVLWIVHSHSPHVLFWSLVALTAPPAAMALIAIITMAAHNSLSRHLDSHILRRIWGRSLQFWLNSLLSLFVLQVNYLIMAQTLSNRQVVIYSLADKVFGSAMTMFLVALQALWPVVTELIVRQQWSRVMEHIRSYLLGGIGFMLAVTAFFLIFRHPILAVLSPREALTIAPSFLLLYGTYQLVMIWTGVFSTVLLSKTDLKPLLILVSVQALICAPLQWILAERFGLYGIVWGLLISFLLTTAWALPLRVRSHMREARSV